MNHKELDCWQQSIELAKLVYQCTQTFPTEEKFGLISQMRRCAVSIPSNISEGAGRNQRGEFIRFLRMAKGSLAELETQIILANELVYQCTQNLSGRKIWTYQSNA
jgi:four helix bundle protein